MSEARKTNGHYIVYDGIIDINSVEELINTACYYKMSEGGFRIYGSSKLNPEGGWLYFNLDGTLTYGLTAKDNICDKFLKKLKDFVGSKYGYVAGDCPLQTMKRNLLVYANKT